MNCVMPPMGALADGHQQAVAPAAGLLSNASKPTTNKIQKVIGSKGYSKDHFKEIVTRLLPKVPQELQTDVKYSFNHLWKYRKDVKDFTKADIPKWESEGWFYDQVKRNAHMDVICEPRGFAYACLNVTIASGFDKIVKLVFNLSRERFAVLATVMPKQNEDWETTKQRISNEVSILNELGRSRHKRYYVKLHHSFIAKDYRGVEKYFLLMRYYPEGDLERFIKAKRKIPYPLAFSLTCNLVRILVDFDKHGFSHGDFKPSNIFVIKKRTKEGFVYALKLGDFGMTRKWEEIAKNPYISGTPLYVSPNQYKSIGKYDAHLHILNNPNNSELYSNACKVAREAVSNLLLTENITWAVGSVIYEMLYGEITGFMDDIINTSKNPTEGMERISSLGQDTVTKSLSSKDPYVKKKNDPIFNEMAALYKKLLSVDPAEGLSLRKLLRKINRLERDLKPKPAFEAHPI